MELTGKAESDFYKWYYSGEIIKKHHYFEECLDGILCAPYLHKLHSSMRYGVYVDFFDQCEVEGVEDTVQLECSYMIAGHTREEARNFAVEKNCKRYNQK